jgi:alpha-1,6-mannosyl-glycoprotein beta-1,2-N-acetylglucosaminyltransferase
VTTVQGQVYVQNTTEQEQHTEYPAISVPDFFETVEELSEFIYLTNTQQPVLNQKLHKGAIELVIVVQVHNRSLYLQELVNSLAATPSINTTLLIFSHDLFEATTNVVVRNVSFTRVVQIFYPFSIQTHPREFPGPYLNDCQDRDEHPARPCPDLHFTDTFGNLRNASCVQIKHHWWWKANFVFEKIKMLREYNGLVLFLEEDHYVAPDFLHSLKLMQRFAKYSYPHCWLFALGIHNRINYHMLADYVYVQNSVENLGLAFNRTIWQRVSRFSEHFCKFDDYNWDWSLRHVIMQVPDEPRPVSMIMAAPRAFHIGSCGAHSTDDYCDPNEAILKFKNAQMDLFPKSLYALEQDTLLTTSYNGGWGDPRDHALCMGMSRL